MAFWNRKVEEKGIVNMDYTPSISDMGVLPNILNEQFKGQVELNPIKFPSDLGEEHPFDFKIFEDLYKKFGFFTAVVDKYIDFVVGPGFYVECKDDRAKQIIEDFMTDTDFETLLRAWCKEALIKGNGFLEIGGSNTEGVKGMKILNANYMYINRDKFGNVLGYNQYKGAFNKFDKDKVVPFNPQQIAHCPINMIGDSAYGIGIGCSALNSVNNVLMQERDLHRIMFRKANSPLHAKLGMVQGDVKIIPKPEDVTAFGQKMETMDNKTEWATDPLVDLKVIDFGNIGEKFSTVLEHDMNMLTYIFQIPAVLLGLANINEGIAKVQMEAFQRRIQSIQAELEKIIEEKIFKRVLNANGLDIHVEFQWGTPSIMEVEGRIQTITDLMKSPMVSQTLRSMCEDEMVNLLEFNKDEYEQKKLEEQQQQEEERQRLEAQGQPVVPGQNQHFPQSTVPKSQQAQPFKKKVGESLISPINSIILEQPRKKKFLFIGTCGLALDYALHLLKEGHDVKYYFKEKSDVGDGMIDKVTEYEPYVDWADVIFIDDVGFGETTDELIKRGKKVINGQAKIEKLENDRVFGLDLLRKAKVPVLRSREFTDFQSAQEFVKAKQGKWVFKPITNMDRHFTYIGHQEDGSDMIEMLEKYKQEWNASENKIDFLLQEFVDGLEVAVTFLCNGNDILKPYCLNFEHKHSDTGEIGSITGETGTVLMWLDKCDIFDKMINKVKNYFKGYVGFADLNCIFGEDGIIYPLEWTAGRAGYPISCIMEECLNVPMGEFLYDWAYGKLTEAPFDKFQWQVGVMLSGQGAPFKQVYQEMGNNMPIFGVKDIEEHIHFVEVKKPVDKLLTAGESGSIMVVTNKDEDLGIAKQKTYNIIERGENGVDDIFWEGITYRLDIGDKVVNAMEDIEKIADIEPEEVEEKYINKNYEYQKPCSHIQESWDNVDDIEEWLGFKYKDYIKQILANIKDYNFAQIKANTDSEREAGYLSENQINELKGILERGLKNGLSISAIAKEVDDKLGLKDLYRMSENGQVKKGISGLPILAKTAEKRAVSIVRSEITRLANQGAVDYYEENGVDKVKWVASFGNRTCPDCEALNGTIFNIGEEEEMPLHPMCRCTYSPVVELK